MRDSGTILFSLFPPRVYHGEPTLRQETRSQGRRRHDLEPVKEPVITLSAGPVAAYPRVLRAMSRPVHYDFDPYFQQFYENVTRKAARRCACKQPALILHCEPAPGIEAAAASLISPDDVVLNLASGVYGKGFGYWSARYHKEMVEIEVPYNEAIDPAAGRGRLPQAAGHQGGVVGPSRHALRHHQSGAGDRQDRARQ